jgi:hypothetical protein
MLLEAIVSVIISTLGSGHGVTGSWFPVVQTVFGYSGQNTAYKTRQQGTQGMHAEPSGNETDGAAQKETAHNGLTKVIVLLHDSFLMVARWEKGFFCMGKTHAHS